MLSYFDVVGWLVDFCSYYYKCMGYVGLQWGGYVVVRLVIMLFNIMFGERVLLIYKLDSCDVLCVV